MSDTEVSHPKVKSDVPTLPHSVPKEKRTVVNHVEIIIFKLVAILFWAYIILNTFVLNVDSLVDRWMPYQVSYLIKYKFVFILVLVLCAIFFLPKHRVSFYIIYVVAFPITQFVRLLMLVVKTGDWSFVFSFLNVIINLFVEIRQKFIFSCFVVFSIYLSLLVNNEFASSFSIAILIGLLIFVYFRAFKVSLKPSSAVTLYSRILGEWMGPSNMIFALDGESKGVDVALLDSSQKKERQTKLEYSVIHNRICLFVAHKLDDYQKSGWKLLPSVFNVLSLLFWNVFFFSILYYSLWKIDPDEFALNAAARYFDFYYFSFNNLIFNSISEVLPNGDIARVFYILQIFSLFLVLAIFMSSYFSHQSDKHTADISEVIQKLDAGAANMEDHMRSEFSVENVEAAISSLRDLESALLNFILGLTNRLDGK